LLPTGFDGKGCVHL